MALNITEGGLKTTIAAITLALAIQASPLRGQSTTPTQSTMSLTTDNGPQPPPSVLRAWFSLHHCPACGSTNVRRSTLRSREVGAHGMRSPYRCRACSERFWVLSRKARTLTIAGIVAGFAAVLVVAYAMVAPPDDDSAMVRIPPASEDVEILTATPPRDAAPKKAVSASSSAAAPPAPPPAPAGVEKPLRPPAQPFVK